MATFYIYCPCKVETLGLAYYTSNAAYLFEENIRNGRRKCRHCGAKMVFAGEDERLDKMNGVTKKHWKEAEANAEAARLECEKAGL